MTEKIQDKQALLPNDPARYAQAIATPIQLPAIWSMNDT